MVVWLAAEVANFLAVLLDVFAAIFDFLSQIGHFFFVAEFLGIYSVEVSVAAGSIAVLRPSILRAGQGALAALSDAFLVLHEVAVVVSELVDVTTVPSDVAFLAFNSAEVKLL